MKNRIHTHNYPKPEYIAIVIIQHCLSYTPVTPNCDFTATFGDFKFGLVAVGRWVIAFNRRLAVTPKRRSQQIAAFLRYSRKGSVGVSRDCPIFSDTPYYLRNGESYGFQILHAHLWAQSEQKPIKNSGKV